MSELKNLIDQGTQKVEATAAAKKQKDLTLLDREVTKVFNALNKDKKATSQAVIDNNTLSLRFGGPNSKFGRLTNLFGWRNTSISTDLTVDDIKSCINNNESFKAYAASLKDAGHQINLDNIKAPNASTLRNNLALLSGPSSIGAGIGSLSLPVIATGSVLGFLTWLGGMALCAGGIGLGIHALTREKQSYVSLSLSFEKATQDAATEQIKSDNNGENLLDELNQKQITQPVTVPAKQNIIK